MIQVIEDAVTRIPSSPLKTEEDCLLQRGDRLKESSVEVEAYGCASLPTRFGTFVLWVFRSNQDDKEHVALVHGRLGGAHDVLTRVHSECLTGDVLGSLRCDCRDQLEMFLAALSQAPRGVLLYMRQEGRGIGLGNKIRAYQLQEEGMDTFEANHHLGFQDDMRDYHVAALILKLLGIQSIQLATNNPRKLFALRSHGVVVAARVPLMAPCNPHNKAYLATKAKKSRHFFP